MVFIYVRSKKCTCCFIINIVSQQVPWKAQWLQNSPRLNIVILPTQTIYSTSATCKTQDTMLVGKALRRQRCKRKAYFCHLAVNNTSGGTPRGCSMKSKQWGWLPGTIVIKENMVALGVSWIFSPCLSWWICKHLDWVAFSFRDLWPFRDESQGCISKLPKSAEELAEREYIYSFIFYIYFIDIY